MPPISSNRAAIPNPALKLFSVLVGEWDTVGKHRLLPDTTLHGHTSFAWLEGGAYLIMHAAVDTAGFPSGMAIFGSDDKADTYSMLYFDERGVSRIFTATLRDQVWKYWRDAPGFSQRFTGTLSADGDTLHAISELQEADLVWKRDMEMTYTRVK